MRKGLLAVFSALLALSLGACAHQSGGYAYVGGGDFDECMPGEDCYGGPQYTCVFVQPPTAPARLEINLASRDHHPRIVGPRDEGPGMRSSDSSSSGSSSSSSVISSSLPPMSVAREPVVVASPSVDRGSPRAH